MNTLPLDDPKWKELTGGYRLPFDASIPLSKLEQGADEAESIWAELWENLYHQRDVGVASYAAIPHLAKIIRDQKIHDWNPFRLTVAIELVRGEGKNPELPDWLKDAYFQALKDMTEYLCENIKEEWDSDLLKSALSLVAIIKGNRDLAELIYEIDDGYEKKTLELFFDL